LSGDCAQLPDERIRKISAALEMRRIFSVIALESDLISATACNNDMSYAAFTIMNEIDLGFLTAIG
jgi:hypothetical protein